MRGAGRASGLGLLQSAGAACGISVKEPYTLKVAREHPVETLLILSRIQFRGMASILLCDCWTCMLTNRRTLTAAKVGLMVWLFAIALTLAPIRTVHAAQDAKF